MFTFRSWTIGKIMGIPIGVDPSWLIIFALLTFQLATGIFPMELGQGFRRGLNSEALVLGILASLLLFGSVLAHELSHAWMAMQRGIPVLGITLFIFGGVAQIGDEPDRPSTEFWVAIMGPLMSFTLAIVFAIFWIYPQSFLHLLPEARPILLPFAVVGAYLAQTNALLVVFNLLPGFPLDGGRVLRAFIWGSLHNLSRATFISMVVGRVIAGAMIGGGLLLAWLVGWSALWFVLVGGFLWQAAGEAYRSVLVRDLLKGTTAGRLMHAPVVNVEGALSVRDFVFDFLVRQRAGLFAVVENRQAVGVIGASQIKDVPRAHWDTTRVQDVMLSLPQSDPVRPGDTALQAMQRLTRRDREEVPVLEGDQIVGVIGREEIARYLQWRGKH